MRSCPSAAPSSTAPTRRWGEWVAGVNVAYDSDEFTENGVVGDPTEGDAELGAAMLAEAGEKLSTLLDALD